MTRVANFRFAILGAEQRASRGASKHLPKSSGLWGPRISVQATSSEGFGTFLCSKESTLPMSRQILLLFIFTVSRAFVGVKRSMLGQVTALIDKCRASRIR